MPARAPQEEFGPRIRPRIGPRKRRSSPKRAVDKFGFALSLSLSPSLSLYFFVSLLRFRTYTSLYTSLDLVFSCSLVLPLRAPKAEFGPRIGPRKRRSGPERQLTSSDLLSLSLSLSFFLYIFIYIIYMHFLLHFRTSPYISITSLYLVFSCSRVLPLRAPKAEFAPRIRPRIGPRKRRSGPERTVDKFGFALSLSLSLPPSLSKFPFTCPYISIHLFTLFFHVFLCCLYGPRKRSSSHETGGSGPETRVRAPKDPERAVQAAKDKFGFAIYIYISF